MASQFSLRTFPSNVNPSFNTSLVLSLRPYVSMPCVFTCKLRESSNFSTSSNQRSISYNNRKPLSRAQQEYLDRAVSRPQHPIDQLLIASSYESIKLVSLPQC